MKADNTNSITTMEQLAASYSKLEKKCQQIEDFEDPQMTYEQMIEQFVQAQKYIAANSVFSPN